MKIEKGTISLYVYELFKGLSVADKLKLADALACSNDVIKYVAQQIIERWTDQGSHSSVSFTATADNLRGLEAAWRDVAKRSGEVAKQEIERLEQALRYRERQEGNLRDEVDRLRAEIALLESSSPRRGGANG